MIEASETRLNLLPAQLISFSFFSFNAQKNLGTGPWTYLCFTIPFPFPEALSIMTIEPANSLQKDRAALSGNLPFEIFSQLFSFLPPASIAHSSSISSTWRQHILSNPKLHQEIDLTAMGRIQDANLSSRPTLYASSNPSSSLTPFTFYLLTLWGPVSEFADLGEMPSSIFHISSRSFGVTLLEITDRNLNSNKLVTITVEY